MSFLSKRMRITAIIILFILTSANLELFAQNVNWYVNKNATGNNSGISWNNGWNELDQINWNLINPGDTIFISGGISSIVYTTTMTIDKSGLPNKFIVITKGKDSQNNGEVIIDGQGTTNYGISLSKTSAGGLSYIKISKLTLQNHSSSVLVRQNSNVIFLDSLKIRGQRGQGAIFINGYNSNNNYNLIDSVFIRNCDIRSDYQTSAQTDNIYVQYANNIFILGNRIEQLNTVGDQHCDCIQTTWYLGNQTIGGNILYNAKQNDSQGIMLHTSLAGFETIVYNNVIYSGGNGTAYFEHAPYPDNVGNCKLFNNTFYVKGGNGYVSQAAILAHKSVEIKNNIFVSNGVGAIHYNTLLTTSFNANNNLMKSGDDRYTVVIDGYGKTLSYWQALKGQDNNSIVANPAFVNVENRDVSLQEISPAIDAGTILDNSYSLSLNGLLRPQGAAWDIGAFEYSNGSIGDITPPQIISAELLDSVSLIIEFSELMDEPSVENISNYVINNGIIVLDAIMEGSNVRLLTSAHTSGLYQATVSNVLDVAGNMISLQNNTIIYEYFNSINNLLRLPIVQADAEHWYLNYEPNRTIDGITGGESRWGGSVPMPDTIVYNLNDVQILNMIKLSFYAWDNGRIYNYSVQVSIDSLSWNEIRTNIPSQSSEWSIEEVEPIEAKFIKIILLSNNQSVWAGLWEVEFWGHLKLPTDSEEEDENLPVAYSLEQNYPNPFNPTTKIKVIIPENTHIRLMVYNLLGELVTELTNAEYESGIYEFDFNADGLASGIYLFRLESPNFTDTKKMVLLH